MMRAALPCLAVLVALAPMPGCGGKPRPASSEAPRPEAAPTFASRFSAEGAWKHLAAQVAMGPRAHAMPGQVKLQAYIREHLKACGAVVSDREFTFKTSRDPEPVPFNNIVGRFAGESDQWILIGTHYDTRLWADMDPNAARQGEPIEGANDGGSGTAVMLEIASVLRDRKLPIGVELVFFDGEEYGTAGSDDYFIGSRAMVQSWAMFYQTKPAAVIVLDMVGDADLNFLREANSDAKNAWLNDHIWRAGQSIAPLAFGKGKRGILDDHTAFLDSGIPATLLIDFDYPWWHCVGDTLDKCSPESLGITGKTVLSAFLDQPVPTAPP